MSMRMKMTEYGDYVAWPGAPVPSSPGENKDHEVNLASRADESQGLAGSTTN